MVCKSHTPLKSLMEVYRLILILAICISVKKSISNLISEFNKNKYFLKIHEYINEQDVYCRKNLVAVEKSFCLYEYLPKEAGWERPCMKDGCKYR